MATQPYPLARERNVIVAVLLGLSALCWLVLIRQQMSMSEDDAMSLTMGFAAPAFLGIWTVMMVAMMFPTAAPMIVMYARIQKGKEARSQPFVPVWIFVAAYLAVWTAGGVVAFAAAAVAQDAAEGSMRLMDWAPRVGGGLLIAAGAYQLSPLKRACLGKCRTPLQFIMTSWRDGRGGALRMGAEHAIYCLGCCWMLFVILFPLGIMNVAAMAAITLLIFLEKSSPVGEWASAVAAVGLIAYGALVLAVPGALPTMM